jgi:hypothetical protein
MDPNPKEEAEATTNLQEPRKIGVIVAIGPEYVINLCSHKYYAFCSKDVVDMMTRVLKDHYRGNHIVFLTDSKSIHTSPKTSKFVYESKDRCSHLCTPAGDYMNLVTSGMAAGLKEEFKLRHMEQPLKPTVTILEELLEANRHIP